MQGITSSPRKSKEVHVSGQRFLDHLLKGLLLGYGLLHPLLRHLLEALLLSLRQLHPLLGCLMEGLTRSPLALLLRLLGDVERRGVKELDVAAHLVLHHLLEGLLLPLYLIRHGLHRRDPSPSNLLCCLLAPAYAVTHLSLSSRLTVHVTEHIFPPGRLRNFGAEIASLRTAHTLPDVEDAAGAMDAALG